MHLVWGFAFLAGKSCGDRIIELKNNVQTLIDARVALLESGGASDDAWKAKIEQEMKAKAEAEEVKMVEHYGEWQTEPYTPPVAVDGKVPKNKYGIGNTMY